MAKALIRADDLPPFTPSKSVGSHKLTARHPAMPDRVNFAISASIFAVLPFAAAFVIMKVKDECG